MYIVTSFNNAGDIIEPLYKKGICFQAEIFKLLPNDKKQGNCLVVKI
jgi:hypothetical protein